MTVEVVMGCDAPRRFVPLNSHPRFMFGAGSGSLRSREWGWLLWEGVLLRRGVFANGHGSFGFDG